MEKCTIVLKDKKKQKKIYMHAYSNVIVLKTAYKADIEQ